MKIDTFLKENEKIEKSPLEEQIGFYKRLIKNEPIGSKIRLHAYFYYARIFYQAGDFRKSREILEPLLLNYQCYAYEPKIISCFNLMGVSCHCEAEYELTRYFYKKALEIAEAHNDRTYYSYEHNNIALTYIAEENFNEALASILLAEKFLPDSDKEMGAYVYLNKAIIYHNLNLLEESLQAYTLCLKQYHGEELLPDDVLLCSTSLFYKLGNKEKYETAKNTVRKNLKQMYAAEFMDACRVLFDCGLDSEDFALVQEVIDSMEQYLQKYPRELRVGVKVEELKFRLAEKQNNSQAMLLAVEEKTRYKHQIIKISEQQRTRTYDQFLAINNDLRKAIESKEKASQVKTQFLSNMSHDMRTPLNGIIGMLSIIQKNRDDAARVDDCLDKIALSADHLLSLVNDVLEMTKLETDSITIENEPFELDQVCADAMHLITFQAQEAGLHVHEEHDDVRGIHLLGSPLYLKKILLNLFSNSIKYNKPGGHIYTSLHIIERTEDVITLKFQIQDTGIGMSEDFIKNKLFQPFVQAKDSARSTYTGTGLGMAIVEQIVKKLGGTMDVKSKLGEGSYFTVILPFEIDQNPEIPEDMAPTEANLQGMRFLLVEDNELNMEIAEFLLKEDGALIEKAINGQEAVELFEAAPAGTFNAILMDLMMPVMDGYEATKKIRALGKPDSKTIPIIAMSAKAFAEDVSESLAAGMNAHLTKPLFREELISTIAKYCH